MFFFYGEIPDLCLEKATDKRDRERSFFLAVSFWIFVEGELERREGKREFRKKEVKIESSGRNCRAIRVSGHQIFAYCIFFSGSNFSRFLHPLITLELMIIFRLSIIDLYWFWFCWNLGVNFS